MQAQRTQREAFSLSRSTHEPGGVLICPARFALRVRCTVYPRRPSAPGFCRIVMPLLSSSITRSGLIAVWACRARCPSPAFCSALPQRARRAARAPASRWLRGSRAYAANGFTARCLPGRDLRLMHLPTHYSTPFPSICNTRAALICMARGEGRLQLQDLYRQQGDQCCPNLSLQRTGCLARKGFRFAEGRTQDGPQACGRCRRIFIANLPLDAKVHSGRSWRPRCRSSDAGDVSVLLGDPTSPFSPARPCCAGSLCSRSRFRRHLRARASASIRAYR